MGVVLAVLGEGALAAALVVTLPAAGMRPGPLWLVPPLAVAFFLAERFVFHVELRREVMSFSLAEVPLAFALVLVAPLALVAARVIGTVGAMAATGRSGPAKLAFNAANLAAEAMVARAVLQVIAGQHPSTAAVVAALVPAVALASLFASTMVVAVVSLFEGDLGRRLRAEAVDAAVTSVTVAALAALAVTPALIDRRLTPLALLPCAAFWYLARAGGHLAQANRDLEEMHSFSRTVGASLDLPTITGRGVEEVIRLLRAAEARVVVFDPETGRERFRTGSAGLDPILPADLFQLDRVLSGADCRELRANDAAWGPRLRAAGVDQLLLATLRDDGQRYGLLAVAGREGSLADRFLPADLRRLTALADQLGVALGKGFLHEALDWAVTHDRLTGLPNRAKLERLLDARLTDPAAAPGAVLGVMVLDLNRFRSVNDALGHQAADRLLHDLARRVEAVLAPGDVLARAGADEFALLAGRPDPADLEALIATIAEQLRRSVVIDGVAIAVSGCFGLAVAGEHGTEAETLLRRAELAVGEAKRHNRGWSAYRHGLEQTTGDQLLLLADLRDGLDRGELELHYQPELDLGTGTIVGVEALMRWNHPTRGLVPPDSFIPLAEQTGLIQPLTVLALEQALATQGELAARGWPLHVAVNVSIRNLLDDLLPDLVHRLLLRYGADPRGLTLEITETAVMADTERVEHNLARLAHLGVGISVDDFGTGYSSLTRLRRLPVSELKIDRSFVTGMLETEQDDVIVRSTIDLAHNLGLRTVAEGVEHDAVIDRLVELGCDLAQGYAIARPLCRSDLHAFLAATPYRIGVPAPVGLQPPSRDV